MTISASGNVGIGTVAPALKLQVESTGDATIGNKSTAINGYTGMNMYDSTGANAASFQYGNPSAPSFTNEFVIASRQAAIPVKFYQGGVTAGNERLRIDSSSQILMLNSNVGIGTTNPASKLEVNAPVDTAFTTQFKLTDGTTGGYWSISEGATGALVYLPTFEFASTGVAGFGGVMVGKIPSANDTFSANNAAITIDGRTTTGTTLSNANLMSVRNNGSAVMTVKANGNLGLGLTNPSTKVAISAQNTSTNYTTSNTTGVLSLLDNTTPSAVGIGPKIVFGSTYYTLGSTLAAASIGSYKEFAPSNGFDEYKHSLVFNTSNNGTGVTEKMRITSDGKVGIGTSSPAETLDVNGSIAIGARLLSGLDGVNNAFWSARGTGTEIQKNALGFNADPSTGLINTLMFRTNGQERITVTNSGNVGIGKVDPTTRLQVDGAIAPTIDNTYPLGGTTLRFTAVYATNGAIQTSDARQKKNIKDSDLGLDFINKLRPVSYNWKSGPDSDVHYGLIAQETEKVVAEMSKQKSQQTPIVDHDKKSDRYGLRYTELISPVIKAVQELYNRVLGIERKVASIEELKAENAQLKKDNQQIKDENKAIKAYLCSKDPKASICK